MFCAHNSCECVSQFLCSQPGLDLAQDIELKRKTCCNNTARALTSMLAVSSTPRNSVGSFSSRFMIFSHQQNPFGDGSGLVGRRRFSHCSYLGFCHFLCLAASWLESLQWQEERTTIGKGHVRCGALEPPRSQCA